MERSDVYEHARRAVAYLLAQEAGEEPTVKHFNAATKILWPHLSVETQSSLVLR